MVMKLMNSQGHRAVNISWIAVEKARQFTTSFLALFLPSYSRRRSRHIQHRCRCTPGYKFSLDVNVGEASTQKTEQARVNENARSTSC